MLFLSLSILIVGCDISDENLNFKLNESQSIIEDENFSQVENLVKEEFENKILENESKILENLDNNSKIDINYSNDLKSEEFNNSNNNFTNLSLNYSLNETVVEKNLSDDETDLKLIEEEFEDDLGQKGRARNLNELNEGKLPPYFNDCKDACDFLNQGEKCYDFCEDDKDYPICYEECSGKKLYRVCDFVCEDENSFYSCYERCSGEEIDVDCDDDCE